MGRKICCTGKPHPDYSARKVLPDRLRKNSCQVQWDFHIYIKPTYISSLCLSLEDMARSKNKNTRSEHAMNAGSLLGEYVWHSYKMKIIIQAFFFQRAFPAGNEDDSIPPPSLNTKHSRTSTRSSRYSLLWLSPHCDFSHFQFQDFHPQQSLFYHRTWRMGSRPK